MFRHYHLLLLLTLFTLSCSAMIPYKDNSLDDLHRITENLSAHQGEIVAFSGEVKGIVEDTHRIKLVLKIDVPLYYYATGQDTLSYGLLLVSFHKETATMSGIQKGYSLKVLARVADYQVRDNMIGKKVGVLHVNALALADRTRHVDFFRTQNPSYALYKAWKKGELFFKVKPSDLEQLFPAEKSVKTASTATSPATAAVPASIRQTTNTIKQIVYDEEEDFILPAASPATNSNN